MNLNYVDIGALALLALVFIVGLIKRPRKNIVDFIVVTVSAVTGYFTFNLIADKLFVIDINGTPLNTVLTTKLTELLGDSLPIDISTLIPMLEQICRLLVFVIETVLLFIVLGLFGKLFKGNRKYKKAKEAGTPIKNGFVARLFGAIFNTGRFTVLISVLLLPVFTLLPVIKNANNITTLIPQLADQQAIVDQVSVQTNESKVVAGIDKLFMLPGNKLVEYKDGEETKNLYGGFSSLLQLSKALPLVQGLTAEDGNPLQTLSEMSTEDLTAVLTALDDNKELITSIIPDEALSELPFDIETISFAEEAPVITCVLQAVEFTDGEMTFKEDVLADQTYVETLANAISTSELIEAIAEPGMLADIPAESKTTVENTLSVKLTAGDIDQAKYDYLMSLFTTPGDPE